MQKLQIVLDDEKVLREHRFSLAKMESAVDSVCVDRYGLVKGVDGFYFDGGRQGAYVDFMSAILALKDQSWFLDNVKTWLWFNSDDSSDPDDFAIEDVKRHYGSAAPAFA